MRDATEARLRAVGEGGKLAGWLGTGGAGRQGIATAEPPHLVRLAKRLGMSGDGHPEARAGEKAGSRRTHH